MVREVIGIATKQIRLAKRLPDGLETDRFIFAFDGKRYERVYGCRYEDKEALLIFKQEIIKSFSEKKTYNSTSGSP